MKEVYFLILGFATVARAQELDVTTIFTLSEFKGIHAEFAKGDSVLPEPLTVKDKISGSSIVQVHTDSKGGKKHYLITNTGRSEIAVLEGGNSWTFVEFLGDSVFTYMICFDHKFDDGSFLVITSGTRAGVFGSTSGRLFSGKAMPSPILQMRAKQNSVKLSRGSPISKEPDEYVVKLGDNGAKIAQNLGTSIPQLQTANPGVNWSGLKVGQKLNVPVKK